MAARGAGEVVDKIKEMQHPGAAGGVQKIYPDQIPGACHTGQPGSKYM
jgi:hypothetical protein